MTVLRQLLEAAYRTAVAPVLSAPVRWLSRLRGPVMVYGFRDPASGAFRKFTRIGSSVLVLERGRLSIGDHVWVGQQTTLDATGGLEIGEGCQIGNGVCVFTHGSHNAIRLLGRSYVDVPAEERRGYVRKPVRIGPYTFIGAGAVILPGVVIGRGCLIGPNCVVMSNVPDFSILAVPPARVIGSTLDSDAAAFREQDFSGTYFDPEIAARLRATPDSPNPPPPA